MMGKVTEATYAMDVPAPRSRTAKAAEGGRKAAPLEVIFLDPSSSKVANLWALLSKCRGLTDASPVTCNSNSEVEVAVKVVLVVR